MAFGDSDTGSEEVSRRSIVFNESNKRVEFYFGVKFNPHFSYKSVIISHKKHIIL